MDLPKTGGDVAFIKSSAFAIAWAAGRVCQQFGPKVIAAEDPLSCDWGKSGRVGELVDKTAEIGRRHAGITAELIDLIGCGFNQ